MKVYVITKHDVRYSDIINVYKPICSLDDIWKLENIVEKQEEVYGVHILSFSKME